MSPKLNYLVFAEQVITNANTGALSVINVFDTLFISSGKTSIFASFAIAGRINLNGGGISDVKVKVSVIDPKNNEFIKDDLIGKKINKKLPLNISAKFDLLEFKIIGKYTVSITIDDQPLDTSSVFLQVLPITSK